MFEMKVGVLALALGSASAACVDSTTWHKTNDEAKTCAWVGAYPSARCDAKGVEADTASGKVLASYACPLACGMGCDDSAMWHKKGDEAKDCAWVAQFAEKRCEVKGEDGTKASEGCTTACGSDEPKAMCDIPAPANGAWVQTGNVFKLWTSESEPRNILTADGQIGEGEYYALLCITPDYTADYGCVVECKDGEVDYSTYCKSADVDSICMLYTETTMYKGCIGEGGLDWDNPEYQDMWQAVLARWNAPAAGMDTSEDSEWYKMWAQTGQGVVDGQPTDMWFGTSEGSPENPVWKGTGMPIFPHGLANLIYMGLGLNTAINSWNWDSQDPTAANDLGRYDYQPLSVESFNLGVWQPWAPGFEYVEDPIQTFNLPDTPGGDGARFFPDAFESAILELTMDGLNFLFPWTPSLPPPAEWDMRANYISVIAMPYQPCDGDDAPVFMGIPKACYHIHQSGIHFMNGQMAPYYRPLSDDTIDWFGVCSYEKIGPNQFFGVIDTLLSQTDAKTMQQTADFQEIMRTAGDPYIPHDRTWGLHLCIDYKIGADEPGGLNRPYPCTLPADALSWPNGALGDMMILDALSFVTDPTHPDYAQAMCDRHLAGDCDNELTVNEPVDWIGDYKLATTAI